MAENWLGLDGKIVLVTGGASGIGRATANSIKAGGATVVIADMTVETGDEVDGMYCIKCNVTDPAEVSSMVDTIVEKYGRIDGLFNNAGINKPCLLVDVDGTHPEYELEGSRGLGGIRSACSRLFCGATPNKPSCCGCTSGSDEAREELTAIDVVHDKSPFLCAIRDNILCPVPLAL